MVRQTFKVMQYLKFVRPFWKVMYYKIKYKRDLGGRLKLKLLHVNYGFTLSFFPSLTIPVVI